MSDVDSARTRGRGSFVTHHHLFEITAGGWREQETQLSGMLSVTDGIGTREWFVCTTNMCANVLFANPPDVSEVVGEGAYDHGVQHAPGADAVA